MGQVATLDKVGFIGYKVDTKGQVYGRRGQPLQFIYTGAGYRAVGLNKGREGSGKTVRIDRLLGVAFANVGIDDKDVHVVYKDGDTNNVALDNLEFVRK